MILTALLSISLAASAGLLQKDNIVLTDKNTVVLRGPVTDESMNELKTEFIKKSSSLFGPRDIYLVLDTPGGSVMAGNSFVDFVKGLDGIKVHTLTTFAASMGFHFVQNLDNRYILESGTLMSHRASLQIGGELGGELDSRLNYIRRTIVKMDQKVSARANMKYDDYQRLIADEIWLDGQDSVTYRFADKVVTAKCDSSLTGTYTQIIPVLFFDVEVVWSKCPLLNAPLAAKIKGLTGSTPRKEKELREMLSLMFNNKKQFVTDYVKDPNSTKGMMFRETFKVGQ
jgi:ATP-dependent protease ClpP protease subunit